MVIVVSHNKYIPIKVWGMYDQRKVNSKMGSVWGVNELDLAVSRIGPETSRGVSVGLSWSSDVSSDHYFVYKRKVAYGQAEDWQSIGTYDFEDSGPVRVLNAYPSETGCGGILSSISTCNVYDSNLFLLTESRL